MVIDQVLGGNSQNGNGAAGIAGLYGSHVFVGKNQVARMVSTIIHELGHTMGLEHYFNHPHNMMSYGRAADATFSGEQLYQAFVNRARLMKIPNYIITPTDMNTLYGGSTNDLPVRANTNRGVAIPAPIHNSQD